MAVTKHIKHSQQEYTCSRCGDTIPKGSPYRYFKPGFRGRVKVKRCMKPECTPQRSELTNSKMSEVYAAQEHAEALIHGLKWSDEATWEEQVEDITNALTEAAGAGTDTIDEYEQALEATPMLEDVVREKIDGIQTWVDELEAWSPSDEPEEDGSENASELFDAS